MKKIRNLLIIDDDIIELSYHKKMIESSGFVKDISFHNDPQKALSELSSVSESEFPEVVLIDIEMPKMDGHELVEKIKNLSHFNPKLHKLIYLTGHATITNLIEASLKDVEYFLRKPLTENKLAEVLIACSGN